MLDYGNKECTSGLSKVIFDLLVSEGLIKLNPPDKANINEYNKAIESAKKYIYCISKAIVEYIKENAEIYDIVVESNIPEIPTVTPQDGGLTLYNTSLKPFLKVINQKNVGKVK